MCGFLWVLMFRSPCSVCSLSRFCLGWLPQRSCMLRVSRQGEPALRYAPAFELFSPRQRKLSAGASSLGPFFKGPTRILLRYVHVLIAHVCRCRRLSSSVPISRASSTAGHRYSLLPATRTLDSVLFFSNANRSHHRYNLGRIHGACALPRG